jgi:hypothetical protein
MRTNLPSSIKRIIQFVGHYSNRYCFGSWIYLPAHPKTHFQDFRLCPIRDYMNFRAAEKLGFIQMKYNESYAMLTLRGKRYLEGL